MLCSACQSKEATVHLSTVLFQVQALREEHLCPKCAEENQPFLNPGPEPLVVASPHPVTALSRKAKAKIQTVEDKLAELDPILERFCERRKFALNHSAEIWPFRAASSSVGEIHYHLMLGPAAKAVDVLTRGFYPEMPWLLNASATLAGRVSRPFRTDILRGLPFAEVARVLEEQLEKGYTLLSGLTPEQVLAKAEGSKASKPSWP